MLLITCGLLLIKSMQKKLGDLSKETLKYISQRLVCGDQTTRPV